ncbi:MAG: histone H1 [Rubrobacteraceae bacterium]
MAERKDQADKEIRELARKLGQRGGLKGGKARAEKLTPEERSEIARKAAEARWAKKRREESEQEPEETT